MVGHRAWSRCLIRVLVASAAIAALAPLPARAAPPPGWTNARLDITPTGRVFLGRYGYLEETGAATLSLDGLPTHAELTLTFDLYVIESWGGNALFDDGSPETVPPDEFLVQVQGGDTLLHTTFSNHSDLNQSYPDRHELDVGTGLPVHSNPYRTGASEADTLGYVDNGYGDSVYEITLTFPHTEGTVAIDFAAIGLQGVWDESWGLDDVRVSADGIEVYSEGFDALLAAPNDLIGDATPIGEIPFVDVIVSDDTTMSSDDPANCGTGRSVWYRLQAPEGAGVRIDTTASSVPTTTSIWSGKPGRLKLVSCGSAEEDMAGLADVIADGTTTYHVMVRGGAGLFRLTAQESFVAKVTFTGGSSSAGQPTVNGVARCSEETTATVRGTIRQRITRTKVAVGSFWGDVSCGPAGIPFSITASSDNGIPFGGGRAEIEGRIDGCASLGCDSTRRTETIRI